MICVSAERAVERLAEGDIPDPFVLDLPITVTVEFFVRTWRIAPRSSHLQNARERAFRSPPRRWSQLTEVSVRW